MPEITKTNKTIGENILRLRTEKGLTQSQLAKLTGVKCKGGGCLISRIEAGTNGDPSLKKLRLLAKALETTIDAILLRQS